MNVEEKFMLGESYIEEDYLWYKDAIIYEVHVRAYRTITGMVSRF